MHNNHGHARTHLSIVPPRKLPAAFAGVAVPASQADDQDLDAYLTKGQRQQRFRRRQHKLRRQGFVVVRAQRWGGGMR